MYRWKVNSTTVGRVDSRAVSKVLTSMGEMYRWKVNSIAVGRVDSRAVSKVLTSMGEINRMAR